MTKPLPTYLPQAGLEVGACFLTATLSGPALPCQSPSSSVGGPCLPYPGLPTDISRTVLLSPSCCRAPLPPLPEMTEPSLLSTAPADPLPSRGLRAGGARSGEWSHPSPAGSGGDCGRGMPNLRSRALYQTRQGHRDTQNLGDFYLPINLSIYLFLYHPAFTCLPPPDQSSVPTQGQTPYLHPHTTTTTTLTLSSQSFHLPGPVFLPPAPGATAGLKGKMGCQGWDEHATGREGLKPSHCPTC